MAQQQSPRVFVTQQPRPNRKNWTPNLEPATEFGSLRYIFRGDEKPYCNPLAAVDWARRELHDFDPERDYLLWPNSGDPAGVALIFLLLGKMGISRIKFLYWERKLQDGERSSTEGFYTPITLTI